MISNGTGFPPMRIAGALCLAAGALGLASCTGGGPNGSPTASATEGQVSASSADSASPSAAEPSPTQAGPTTPGSKVDFSGDPARVCLDLVGGTPANDLAPTPSYVTTHYGPADPGSGEEYGPGFTAAVGGAPITCLLGTPQSEWAVRYGYATYGPGQADALRAWAEGHAGVAKSESDGRTVYTWRNPESDLPSTIHISVGDSDAVFAMGEKIWDRIIDL